MIHLRSFLTLCAALGLAACVDPTATEGPDAAAAGPDAVSAPEITESLPDEPGDYDAIEALTGTACAPRACTATECGMVDDGCRAQMWCGECACGTGAMSCEKSLTQIWEQPLSAGTYTIEVTQLIPTNLDPVLHVISATGVESAWDDNSAGGTRPRATVTVPSGQTRYAVLRPKSDTAPSGAAIVSINGQSYIFGVRGRRQVFTGLRANEEIETIQLPGSAAVHVIYGMSADGAHITQRAYNNGTAGGAVLTQPAAATSRAFWLGTGTPGGQPTHLIRNDRRLSGHDAEAGGGDGLGYELETALGTCFQATGYATNPKDLTAFPCGWAVDVRDTDGDGLSDGNEVRGLRTATPHVPLRRWGADPRHKDLFVEVDGARLSTTDTPPRVTAAQARYFADVYGDRLVDLTASQRGAHASALRNPDQRPGISTHMDTGIQAESAADYTVYGDWGGYNYVPPASGGGGQDPQVAWQSHLRSSRIGAFRYALVWNGGGGQTSTSATCAGCGSYAWGSSNGGGAVMAHEAGHAHGITHSGPAGNQPEIDANCKPSFPSIMNYAYQNDPVGFADGTGLGPINNVRLVETGALGQGNLGATPALAMLGYRVQDGNVDWNRDGVFAPAGSTVRAYANFDPGNACEFTRYNAQTLTTQMNTSLSPALARLGNRTFLFSAGQSQLRYVSTTDDLDCPLGVAACGTWGGYGTFGLDVTRGVDVARVTGPLGRSALLVVGVDALGSVNSTMRLDDGTWTPVEWTGIWGTTTGEPAIETLPDGRALLVFRQSDTMMLYGVHRYDGGTSGAWERWGPVMQCGGGNLPQVAGSSPGLARTNFTGVGPRVWGLFSTATAMYLRSFDDVNMCFNNSEVALDTSDGQLWPQSGRPVGVWQADPANAMGGRLTIIGTGATTDPDRRYVQQMWSYVDAAGQWRIGEKTGFDSFWTYGLGVDAWFEPGIDDNLRVVWTMSNAMSQGQRLRFFPRADGINDFTQVGFSDWEMLRYATCRNLTEQQGSSRIACPPRPY